MYRLSPTIASLGLRLSVFAFAFLIHFKRKNDGQKIVEEYKATHTPVSEEEDPFADEGEVKPEGGAELEEKA